MFEDEELIGDDEKVLVIVTNQYMFEQLLWYRTRYPQGIWDAVVIKFGTNNDGLMDIMYKKCIECGFFRKVICHGYQMPENSLLKKVFMMIRYIYQYVTNSRERNDKKWIEKIAGESDYKKVIINYTHALIPVAALNAMSDSVLVCLEDGFSDYLPVAEIRHWTELVNYMLAKMNVANVRAFRHQYRLKYDNRLIKYCSLPDKMKYRGYKVIKPLFENDRREIDVSEKDLLLFQDKYDVLIFSTVFTDYENSERMYDVLHIWLKENYSDKKIFIKPHPREVYKFSWNDLDIYVGGEEMAGEVLLDLMPNAEVLFMFVSTILLKVYREKRRYKVFRFEGITSEEYFGTLQTVSEMLGLRNEDWVVL